MDESVRGFWSQVADALRDRISSQDWVSWFSGAGAIELGAERIVVEVVNDFAARWVDQKFRVVLEQVVEQVAGVPLQVEIVARAAAAPGDDQTPARPHEELTRAARQRTQELQDARVAEEPRPEPVLVQVAAAPAEAQVERVGAGNVMTSAQLLAELASAEQLQSNTLEQAPPMTHGSPAPAQNGQAPSYQAPRPKVHDAQIAGVQPLNDRYRFETFVIGPGNQMVHAAALSVAETPAQSYNPLFVHGSTGLGKTHLLHAIGNYVRETRPEAHVAYITTEQFIARFRELIAESKGGGQDLRTQFKAYFRGVDVLLIDDVQFLAGTGSWIQEELFHIFNALHESGRQVVLTSDCKPDHIPKLEDRLRSRFAWGLIADIDSPDLETRVAILRKKAHVDELQEIPAEVFELVAERITTNVRELEGALTRVVAAASLSGRPVTLDLAGTVLESYAPGQGEPVTIERIQDAVCEHFALQRDELLSASKSQNVALPRQIGMYLSRTLLGAASTQVAIRFNRKDHSTVLYAERKIDQRMRQDPEVHDVIVRITDQLRAGGGRVGVTR